MVNKERILWIILVSIFIFTSIVGYYIGNNCHNRNAEWEELYDSCHNRTTKWEELCDSCHDRNDDWADLYNELNEDCYGKINLKLNIDNTCSSNNYNCEDFNTYSQAKAIFDHCNNEGYGDIHLLDMDNDGIPCEVLQ